MCSWLKTGTSGLQHYIAKKSSIYEAKHVDGANV